MRWLIGMSLVFASAVAAQPVMAATPLPTVDQLKALNLTQQQENELVEHVMGNVTLVALHQLGHGVLPQMLPGETLDEREFDEFAVFVLSESVRRGETGDVADLAEIVGTAWVALSMHTDTAGAYWADHQLDKQRTRRIACLLYGSDAALHEELLDLIGEANRCVEDYQQMRQVWTERLEGHLRQQQDPQEIALEFLPVQQELAKALEKFLQRDEYLEVVAETINQTLVVEPPIKLAIGECGVPTAAWHEDKRAVHLCYDLIAHWYTGMAPKPGEVEVSEPEPPPFPPGAAQQPPGTPTPPQPLPGGHGTDVGPMNPQVAQVPPGPFPPSQQFPPSEPPPFPPMAQQPWPPSPPQQPPFPSGQWPQAPQMPTQPHWPQQPPGQPKTSLVGTWGMTMMDPQSGMSAQYQLNLQPNGQYAVSVQNQQGRVDSWGTYQVQPGMIVFTLEGSSFPLAQVGTQAPLYYQVLGPNQLRVPDGVLQRMQ